MLCVSVEGVCNGAERKIRRVLQSAYGMLCLEVVTMQQLSWLKQAFSEAIRAPSEQPIDGWLRENVSLDTTSPIQGPYDVNNTPQLRDPAFAFQNEEIRMVTTVGPNQGGRTKIMEGAS
jgi:hypothetical protein